jgi:adenosine/AMP kinase
MSPLFASRVDFRTSLYYGFLALCCLLFVAYTIFQARFILAGPQITFDAAMASVQTERIVTLEGNTANIVKLTLNGREIYTDKGGHFKEALVLENGYTIATLEAHDRYGRSRDVTKTFVYTPALVRQ